MTTAAPASGASATAGGSHDTPERDHVGGAVNWKVRRLPDREVVSFVAGGVEHVITDTAARELAEALFQATNKWCPGACAQCGRECIGILGHDGCHACGP